MCKKFPGSSAALFNRQVSTCSIIITVRKLAFYFILKHARTITLNPLMSFIKNNDYSQINPLKHEITQWGRWDMKIYSMYVLDVVIF